MSSVYNTSKSFLVNKVLIVARNAKRARKCVDGTSTHTNASIHLFYRLTIAHKHNSQTTDPQSSISEDISATLPFFHVCQKLFFFVYASL
jgi:hypothetical protein